MDWASEDNRAEWAVDVVAAAIFAGAVGFATWAVALDAGQATAFIAAAFLVSYVGLRRVSAGERDYALPAFPLETFEPRPEAQGEATGELILQDMLAKVTPQDRVVRLFGASQSHLHSNHSKPAPPDASQALSDALSELRRSLR
jgi:hypothetical protein